MGTATGHVKDMPIQISPELISNLVNCSVLIYTNANLISHKHLIKCLAGPPCILGPMLGYLLPQQVLKLFLEVLLLFAHYLQVWQQDGSISEGGLKRERERERELCNHNIYTHLSCWVGGWAWQQGGWVLLGQGCWVLWCGNNISVVIHKNDACSLFEISHLKGALVLSVCRWSSSTFWRPFLGRLWSACEVYYTLVHM